MTEETTKPDVLHVIAEAREQRTQQRQQAAVPGDPGLRFIKGAAIGFLGAGFLAAAGIQMRNSFYGDKPTSSDRQRQTAPENTEPTAAGIRNQVLSR